MGLVYYKYVFPYANKYVDIQDRFSSQCVSVTVCVCDLKYPWRPEECIGSPGFGVSGSCNSLDI